MKKSIHPKYNQEATVKCIACGTVYTFGSTQQHLDIEICGNCHPVYTGSANIIVDTANKIGDYMKKVEARKDDVVLKKRAKQESRKSSRVDAVVSEKPVTLADMMKQIKK